MKRKYNTKKNKNWKKKNYKGGSKRSSINIANKINSITPNKCSNRNENSCYLVTDCKWDKRKSECHDIDDIGGINCNNLSWYGCLKPCKWSGSMLNGYCQYNGNKKHINRPSTEKEEILDKRDSLITELKRIKREDDKLSKKKPTPNVTKKRLELRSKHRELDLEVEKLNNRLEGIKDHADLQKISINHQSK